MLAEINSATAMLWWDGMTVIADDGMIAKVLCKDGEVNDSLKRLAASNRQRSPSRLSIGTPGVSGRGVAGEDALRRMTDSP
jgi:hypothetical protein